MFDWIEDETQRNKAIKEHEDAIKKVNDGVDAKINEAVSGLKVKNDELLGEKKKIQDLYDKVKDIDPVAAREALKLLRENEYAQLIKDGKFEEVIEKRTSTATAALKKQLDDATKALEEALKSGGTYKGLYESTIIDNTIRDAAIKAGVNPAAMVDVLSRARSVFSLSEDRQVEARDAQGNLLKNDKKLVVTPAVWMDDLKESAPYFWPGSEGAGMGGSDNLSETDFTKKAAALLAKGDHAGYRKLREKQRQGAGV